MKRCAAEDGNRAGDRKTVNRGSRSGRPNVPLRPVRLCHADGRDDVRAIDTILAGTRELSILERHGKSKIVLRKYAISE